MIIETRATNGSVDVTTRAPTAVAPGQRVAVQLTVVAREAVVLQGLAWTLPAAMSVSTALVVPVSLGAGEPRTFDLELAAGNAEGAGLIQAVLAVAVGSAPAADLAWDAWISVFPRERADDPDRLGDAHRQRLLDVVNARTRNGHIFLADYGAFFDDFLNLEVPAALASRISTDLGLPEEGLPLDPERRMGIILGQMRFYGIEEFKVEAEEHCPDGDDRFDAPHALEV